MNKDIETLRQLFGSYLHQDWLDEFDSDTAALEAMIASEPKDVLVKASGEIRALLSANVAEDELKSIMIDEAGCYFEPASRQISYREWLGDVLRQLEAKTS